MPRLARLASAIWPRVSRVAFTTLASLRIAPAKPLPGALRLFMNVVKATRAPLAIKVSSDALMSRLDAWIPYVEALVAR